MTLVQMQHRPAHADAHADLVHRTVDEAMEAAGPQVCDDMTVEVALAVIAGARGHPCPAHRRPRQRGVHGPDPSA